MGTLPRLAEAGTSRSDRSNVITQTSHHLIVLNTMTAALAQSKALISMEVFCLRWRIHTPFASNHSQELAVSVSQLMGEQPAPILSAYHPVRRVSMARQNLRSLHRQLHPAQQKKVPEMESATLQLSNFQLLTQAWTVDMLLKNQSPIWETSYAEQH